MDHTRRAYVTPSPNLVMVTESQLFEAVMEENASKWQAPGR